MIIIGFFRQKSVALLLSFFIIFPTYEILEESIVKRERINFPKNILNNSTFARNSNSKIDFPLQRCNKDENSHKNKIFIGTTSRYTNPHGNKSMYSPITKEAKSPVDRENLITRRSIRWIKSRLNEKAHLVLVYNITLNLRSQINRLNFKINNLPSYFHSDTDLEARNATFTDMVMTT